MDKRIPEDIREFLLDCIETVSQLELLLVIYQFKDKKWSAATVSRELRTNPSMAAKQMETLSSKGILKKEDDLFSYSPDSELTHHKVEKLFELYHERPVAIVTFIFTKPEEKLKGFADAFKLKKD